MAAEMTSEEWCADAVRRHDRERWLTALFAPEAPRRRLLALYAFNLEVARARESVSQAALGLMRVQWWREALDGIDAGRPRAHPVIQALADVRLDRAIVERLLTARELDMEDRPIADLGGLVDYAEATSAGLLHLALDVLGASDAESREAGRHVGIAWALVGLIRAVPFHATRGRLYLPDAVLAQCGADPQAVLAGRFGAALGRAIERVAATADAHLQAARRSRVPRPALSPLLLGPLADRHLARLRRVDFDPFRLPLAPPGPGDQLTLVWRAWRGAF